MPFPAALQDAEQMCKVAAMQAAMLANALAACLARRHGG